MKQTDLLPHIIEIKEAIAALEAKVEAHNGFNGRVQELEKDVSSLKTSHKVYKWVIGLCVAISAAFIKNWKTNN